MLTGSYAPGDVLVFAGLADGTFASPKPLRASDGKPLRVGRASVTFACDWDGDEDIDVVVGNMAGKVFVARNGGGAVERFTIEPIVVAGVELDIATMNAAPCVADWDGDGREDLLLGAFDGRVLLHRNVAERGEPVLEPAVELVGKSLVQADPRASSGPVPGLRTKPAVWDWNEDGLLDLIVGDHFPETGPAPVLTDAQRRELEAAAKENAKIGLRLGEIQGAAFDAWIAERKIPRAQATDHFEDFLLQWERPKEAREILVRQEELASAMKRLNPPTIEHGRVWVFLRRGR